MSVEEAGAAGDGGIGDVVFCMRCRATWASVIDEFAGSAMVRLVYVTSERGAPPDGAEPWQLAQLLTTTACTSHGRPVAGVVPPDEEPPAPPAPPAPPLPPLPLPPELPPPVLVTPQVPVG